MGVKMNNTNRFKDKYTKERIRELKRMLYPDKFKNIDKLINNSFENLIIYEGEVFELICDVTNGTFKPSELYGFLKITDIYTIIGEYMKYVDVINNMKEKRKDKNIDEKDIYIYFVEKLISAELIKKRKLKKLRESESIQRKTKTSSELEEIFTE